MHQNGQGQAFSHSKAQWPSFEKPRKHSRTTNSNHSFFKHPNLIQNLIPAEANLIFVSDIT
ncbi:hypothetical protein LEP1GSC076_1688, partial [Leptospira sp. Fiocruz LV4135]